MVDQSKPRRMLAVVLAIVLWLATAILGLEAIYRARELFYLVFTALGGSVQLAPRLALGVLSILGLIYIIFIVASTEYHWKRVGQPGSWRLFTGALAVEVSIILLYYLLAFLL